MIQQSLGILYATEGSVCTENWVKIILYQKRKNTLLSSPVFIAIFPRDQHPSRDQSPTTAIYNYMQNFMPIFKSILVKGSKISLFTPANLPSAIACGHTEQLPRSRTF